MSFNEDKEEMLDGESKFRPILAQISRTKILTNNVYCRHHLVTYILLYTNVWNYYRL